MISFWNNKGLSVDSHFALTISLSLFANVVV